MRDDLIHEYHEPICRSTQQRAHELLRDAAGARRQLLVSCDQQTAGLGRFGRSWQSPPQPALLMSVAVSGCAVVCDLAQLPRDVVETVVSRTASAGRIRWSAPNDLVSADAAALKVGGVLIDVRSQGDQITRIVVGIGVNVFGSAFTLTDGRPVATLASLGVHVNDLAQLRRVIARDVVARITQRV